jgi:hypothetical protein
VKQFLTTRQTKSSIRTSRFRSSARRALLLVLSLSVLSSLCRWSSAAAPVAAGPEVSMERTTRDFGDVFAGEELEQNFPVRNAGTAPLELAQKSSLSAIPASHSQTLTAALWNPNRERLLRPVSATRAAPS